MLARDYILRIVQEFTEALTLYLKKKKRVDLLDNDYANLYVMYFHQKRAFFIEKTGEEIVNYMKANYDEEEYPERVSMLAELFYQESLALNFGNEDLCRKTEYLLKWYDDFTKTFSFERMQKISQLTAAVND